MGIIRFIVVFLLGIGAAFGTYASGALGNLSRNGSPYWLAPWHPVVLRVDAASGDPLCQRYAIDNHSSRRVLVLVTSAGEERRTRTAADFAGDQAPPSGYYGSSGQEPSYDGAPAVRTRTVIPVEVGPGEEKNVGPRNGGSSPDDATATRCGDNRLVTLTDCATDESGVCSSASTFSRGGDFNRYQGDE